MTTIPKEAAALGLPATTDAATPALLTHALRSGGVLPAGVSVTEVGHEQIAVGTGLAGQLARLRVEYDAPPGASASCCPASVILKLPTTVAETRELAAAFRMYEREGRFYADLAQEVPVRTPRCYWNRIEPGTGLAALLLEDLGSWTNHSQVDGASPDQARAALTGLAGLHGSWWARRASEWPGWVPQLDDTLYLFVDQVYQACWPEFAQRFGGILPPAAMDVGTAVAAALPDLRRLAVGGAPPTLCHGDFRLDNLFFAPGEVALADWQHVHRGPAVTDVAMFLAQSVTVEVRREHERSLVRAWYDRLVEWAPGVADTYPYDLAWEHYRRMTLFATFIPVVVGGALDVGNDRGRDLAVSIAVRGFTAVLDLDATELLP